MEIKNLIWGGNVTAFFVAWGVEMHHSLVLLLLILFYAVKCLESSKNVSVFYYTNVPKWSALKIEGNQVCEGIGACNWFTSMDVSYLQHHNHVQQKVFDLIVLLWLKISKRSFLFLFFWSFIRQET